MAALLSASKSPLGQVGEIVQAQYAERTEASRDFAEQKVELWLSLGVAWLHHTEAPPCVFRHYRDAAARMIADIRARPGGRCVKRVGRGRCRGMSHRFALFSVCYKHRHSRLSAPMPR